MVVSFQPLIFARLECFHLFYCPYRSQDYASNGAIPGITGNGAAIAITANKMIVSVSQKSANNNSQAYPQ